MALPCTLKFVSLSPFSPCLPSTLPPHNIPTTFSSPSLFPKSRLEKKPWKSTRNHFNFLLLHVSYRFSVAEDEDNDAKDCSFNEAVKLFNDMEYYRCHDFLEALWNKAEEPPRTLIHGILQCAVGFHHLFNKNHKGAMMELGEGVCKLRKMNFKCGPFYQFEKEISAALDFIYHTQIELAACADDLCLTMDRSERSYQLLGGYAAGQHLYSLQSDNDQIMYIVFSPQRSYGTSSPPRVKLPTLNATEEHLVAFENK